MYIAKFLVYFSILVWLLPPFRQIRGGYFLYFLALGFSDPFALIFLWLIKLNVEYVHLIIAFILAISILFYNKKLNINWTIGLTLLLLVSIWRVGIDKQYFYFIIFHFIILMQIMISAVKEVYQKQRINIYFSILFIYELTTILKFIIYSYNYTSGIYMFYLSLVFEMIIGLFFIFYNLENTPIIKLPSGITEQEF